MPCCLSSCRHLPWSVIAVRRGRTCDGMKASYAHLLVAAFLSAALLIRILLHLSCTPVPNLLHIRLDTYLPKGKDTFCSSH